MRARLRAGSSRLAGFAMMAITSRSSIRVKAGEAGVKWVEWLNELNRKRRWRVRPSRREFGRRLEWSEVLAPAALGMPSRFWSAPGLWRLGLRALTLRLRGGEGASHCRAEGKRQRTVQDAGAPAERPEEQDPPEVRRNEFPASYGSGSGRVRVFVNGTLTARSSLREKDAVETAAWPDDERVEQEIVGRLRQRTPSRLRGEAVHELDLIARRRRFLVPGEE